MECIFKNICFLTKSEDQCSYLENEFLQNKLCRNVSHCNSESELLQELELQHSNHALPDMIIIDIDEFDLKDSEIILKVRSKYSKQNILFVVVSKNSELIKKSYTYNVVGYFNKPLKTDQFSKKVVSFHDYWAMNIKPFFVV